MSDKQAKEPAIFTVELISDIPDVNGLQVCMAGMEMTSQRMRKATLEYLWDKYVTHGKSND